VRVSPPLLVWLALNATVCGAQEPARIFVGCPVYRDTDNGRKSGCWLATDPETGERYDISQGRSKPQLGREVLVEGRLDVTSPQACGAPVLVPVHVSVLAGSCPGFVLPAEGYPGRRYEVPAGQVLPPADVVRPPLEPPFGPRSWSIAFGYRSDFLQYQYSEVILDQIGRYVVASHPREVVIVGYAVTADRVVSGHHLSEPKELARSRAAMVREALVRLGVAPGLVHVSTAVNPPPSGAVDDGFEASSRRRVDISVVY